jgi:hypothetical protein
MKISNFIIIFCLISVISCATVKNNAGYVITNKSIDNKVYKQTYCNEQKAVAWQEIDGFNHLGWVFFHVEQKRYVVQINDKVYPINMDKIKPLDVAQREGLRIAIEAGFTSYTEYGENFQRQRVLAEEERKRQEEERRLENNRLRNEIDKNFGVVAVGSLLHVKNGEVKIGEIIRLGDTFSYNTNSWARLNSGAYVFGDFQEFEIRGLDMRNVNVKVINPDRSGHFMQGGNITAGGRRGYIVKYLGTEDVITVAGLRKVVWVLECIGGNIYAE